MVYDINSKAADGGLRVTCTVYKTRRASNKRTLASKHEQTHQFAAASVLAHSFYNIHTLTSMTVSTELPSKSG